MPHTKGINSQLPADMFCVMMLLFLLSDYAGHAQRKMHLRFFRYTQQNIQKMLWIDVNRRMCSQVESKYLPRLTR
jgi:hypothetical protein